MDVRRLFRIVLVYTHPMTAISADSLSNTMYHSYSPIHRDIGTLRRRVVRFGTIASEVSLQLIISERAIALLNDRTINKSLSLTKANPF